MSDETRKGCEAATLPVDNPEWTEEDFARAKPASELLGKEAATLLVRKRTSGGLTATQGFQTNRTARRE